MTKYTSMRVSDKCIIYLYSSSLAKCPISFEENESDTWLAKMPLFDCQSVFIFNVSTEMFFQRRDKFILPNVGQERIHWTANYELATCISPWHLDETRGGLLLLLLLANGQKLLTNTLRQKLYKTFQELNFGQYAVPLLKRTHIWILKKKLTWMSNSPGSGHDFSLTNFAIYKETYVAQSILE